MIGIIVLAAGNSSRLGEPKQLLSFGNQTLIRRIAEAAVQVSPNETVVVLGASSATIELELNGLTCGVVKNEQWSDGLSSSITTGLSHLLSVNEGLEGVILTVCDQPMVSSDIFRKIIYKFRSEDKGIVACSYDDTVGTPVLFSARYFSDLLQLTGGYGAKKLLQFYQNDLTTLPFPDGGIDVDTKEDYQRLQDRQ